MLGKRKATDITVAGSKPVPRVNLLKALELSHDQERIKLYRKLVIEKNKFEASHKYELDSLRKIQAREKEVVVAGNDAFHSVICKQCGVTSNQGDCYVCERCAFQFCNTHHTNMTTCSYTYCKKTYCISCVEVMNRCAGHAAGNLCPAGCYNEEDCMECETYKSLKSAELGPGCSQHGSKVHVHKPSLRCCHLDLMKCGMHECEDCEYNHHAHCSRAKANGGTLRFLGMCPDPPDRNHKHGAFYFD